MSENKQNSPNTGICDAVLTASHLVPLPYRYVRCLAALQGSGANLSCLNFGGSETSEIVLSHSIWHK